MMHISPALIGLILDIIGASLLAKGVVMSDQQIFSMTAMHWDLNVNAAKEYIGNAFDAMYGLGFLIVGFVFQSDAAIGRSDEVAALSALVAGIGAGLTWWPLRRRYIERRIKRVQAVWNEKVEPQK